MLTFTPDMFSPEWQAEVAARKSAGMSPLWSGCTPCYGVRFYGCGHTVRQHDNGDSKTAQWCHECRKALVGTEIACLRRGKPPVSGFSRNHATGAMEAGVSVYHLVDGIVADVDRFQDRPAYVGRGVVVGFGSDGELVVRLVGAMKRRKE